MQREWVIGEPIGDAAGFGRVFRASSADYPDAVAKFVPKMPGAERELLLADGLDGVGNVVPIIESGETQDDWVLIMPRAKKSLLAHIREYGAPLPIEDAVAVLSDVATALANLDGRVVHRDLKPANILLLNSRWCVADFGISRYAEATTAPDTRKLAWTAPYAAPEQWRAERATSATDVYAFGIIAFEMLASHRPFQGPEWHDFREQHLHAAPPALTGHPTALAALVEECLFKAPAARPSAANLLVRLERAVSVTSNSGIAALQEANRAEIARRSATDRAASASRSAAERRADLADAAGRILTRIGDALKDAVMEAAPSAALKVWPSGGWTLTLNEAELEFTLATKTALEPWGGWQPPAFDVVAHAAIGVTIPMDRYGYKGRSHSLWYCDAQEDGRYHWFETAFMLSPFQARTTARVPFARPPGIEAAKAIWNGIAEFQVAWPFTEVHLDDLGEFINRWAGWFAAGAQRALQHPTQIPEQNPQGSWRR
ncbi:serine/threonine protein kinase [Planosporangium thailandense]|uniref:Serine/threonine protein kinase n=1 Tax=Planosporangium thailandense TaxID=765197 RepID=A0ABX0Y6H2_9ACTN|nr:serine/threonine protein kinase [Planosporangium thailandense]